MKLKKILFFYFIINYNTNLYGFIENEQNLASDNSSLLDLIKEKWKMLLEYIIKPIFYDIQKEFRELFDGFDIKTKKIIKIINEFKNYKTYLKKFFSNQLFTNQIKFTIVFDWPEELYDDLPKEISKEINFISRGFGISINSININKKNPKQNLGIDIFCKISLNDLFFKNNTQDKKTKFNKYFQFYFSIGATIFFLKTKQVNQSNIIQYNNNLIEVFKQYKKNFSRKNLTLKVKFFISFDFFIPLNFNDSIQIYISCQIFPYDKLIYFSLNPCLIIINNKNHSKILDYSIYHRNKIQSILDKKQKKIDYKIENSVISY